MSINYDPSQNKPPRSKKWMLWIGGIILALFVGVGIGGAGDTTTAASSEPKAQTTVTQTITPPTATVTHQAPSRKITVAPESCKKALALADDGFSLAGTALGHAADAMDAITEFDLDKIEKASAGMSKVNQQVSALKPKYQAARDECNSH